MNILSLCSNVKRKIIILLSQGLSLGWDTNISKNNIHIEKTGKMVIGDGVSVRDNTYFSVSQGGQLIIESGCFFNRNCLVVCHDSIIIGKNTILGPNVSIYDHNHTFSKADGIGKNTFRCKGVFIGEGCWIGANVVILKGTHLGHNCVVGAGVVLSGNYSDNTLIKAHQSVSIESIY